MIQLPIRQIVYCCILTHTPELLLIIPVSLQYYIMILFTRRLIITSTLVCVILAMVNVSANLQILVLLASMIILLSISPYPFVNRWDLLLGFINCLLTNSYTPHCILWVYLLIHTHMYHASSHYTLYRI